MGVEAGSLSALRMETLLTLPAPVLPFCWATKESAALVLLFMADSGLAGLPCVAEAAWGDMEPPPQAANPKVNATANSAPPL
jgi:hypothetical protein